MIIANEQPRDTTDAVVTVPNVITVLRIAMVVIAGALFIVQTRESVAVILCGIAVALDWVDGRLARRLAQCSKLGGFMDPVADKMTMTLVYVVIAINLGSLVIWLLVGLILVRDIVITLLRSFGYKKQHGFPASDQLAKTKTTLQGAVGIAVLFYVVVVGGGFDWLLDPVVFVLCVIALLSYVSAWRYLSRHGRHDSRV